VGVEVDEYSANEYDGGGLKLLRPHVLFSNESPDYYAGCLNVEKDVSMGQ
jgi:hypothetical protein